METEPPFELQPQFRLNYYDTYKRLSYETTLEVTRFNREGRSRYINSRTSYEYGGLAATRYHLEPSLRYHLLDFRGTTLDAGARIFLTHYDQGHMVGSQNADADLRSLGVYDEDHLWHSRTRKLYELEVRGKTTFARKAIDMRHTQTIEPEFKYQFIPYRNQSGIALYDSTDRVEDFYSLFSWRRYAGIDRIADVNAVTFGVTSRLLDAHDREILKVGIAQAYNFEPTRVSQTYLDKTEDYPRSLLAIGLDCTPFEHVTFHHATAYNTQDSKIDTSATSLRYASNGWLLGVSYRFGRDSSRDLKKYLRDQDAYLNGSTKSRPVWQSADLKQLGLELSIPLGSQWRLSGAWYRELGQKLNMDRKIAVKYEDCCWSVAFVYEDYLRLRTRRGHLERHDKRIFGIEFSLKGFMEMGARGITSPISTDTQLYGSFDPIQLNR